MNPNQIEDSAERYATLAADKGRHVDVKQIEPVVVEGALNGIVADYPTLDVIKSILAKRHAVGESAAYRWKIYGHSNPQFGAGMIYVDGQRALDAKPERMLQWFKFEHLPSHLQETSKPFAEIANLIVQTLESGPERTTALRKLLESKDAAVRAKLVPGG